MGALLLARPGARRPRTRLYTDTFRHRRIAALPHRSLRHSSRHLYQYPSLSYQQQTLPGAVAVRQIGPSYTSLLISFAAPRGVNRHFSSHSQTFSPAYTASVVPQALIHIVVLSSSFLYQRTPHVGILPALVLCEAIFVSSYYHSTTFCEQQCRGRTRFQAIAGVFMDRLNLANVWTSAPNEAGVRTLPASQAGSCASLLGCEYRSSKSMTDAQSRAFRIARPATVADQPCAPVRSPTHAEKDLLTDGLVHSAESEVLIWPSKAGEVVSGKVGTQRQREVTYRVSVPRLSILIWHLGSPHAGRPCAP